MAQQKSTAFDALTPFERAVLVLLWRIVRNTCPLLSDAYKDTGPPPEVLIETLSGAAQPATAPRRRK